MSITQLADSWFAAVQRHCAANACAYLRDDHLDAYTSKHAMNLSIVAIRGIAIGNSVGTDASYDDMLKVMLEGKSPMALSPELTVNGPQPGSTVPAYTCNMRLVVLQPLAGSH